tara:strand:- start:71 stop:511 length:441 start_codon:yes stop_codon:yes gene_type:complete
MNFLNEYLIGGGLSWDDIKILPNNGYAEEEVDEYGTDLNLILEVNNKDLFENIKEARVDYLVLEEKLKSSTLNMKLLERIKLKKELRVGEESFTKIIKIIGEINKEIVNVTFNGVAIPKYIDLEYSDLGSLDIDNGYMIVKQVDAK